MAKLIIECNDASLLAHILRGAIVDLAHIELTTKQPSKKREAQAARASARIK